MERRIQLAEDDADRMIKGRNVMPLTYGLRRWRMNARPRSAVPINTIDSGSGTAVPTALTRNAVQPAIPILCSRREDRIFETGMPVASALLVEPNWGRPTK